MRLIEENYYIAYIIPENKMNSLIDDIAKVQVELSQYNTKKTKVQATKLRKVLTSLKNSVGDTRKEILTETKSKPKKEQQESEVELKQEIVFVKVEPKVEVTVKEEPLDPMEMSIVLPSPPLLKREKTRKSQSKKNL